MKTKIINHKPALKHLSLDRIVKEEMNSVKGGFDLEDYANYPPPPPKS